MQCEYVYGDKQCTNAASWNSTFCSIHDGVHKVSPSTRPDFNYRSDRAFTPYSDKLTKDQKIFIKGLGEKPKVVKKTKVYTPRQKHVTIDPTYMTISEVSNLLRVSPLTIKRWEKLGGEKKLHPIRINSRGDRRYLREEIQRFIGAEHD